MARGSSYCNEEVFSRLHTYSEQIYILSSLMLVLILLVIGEPIVHQIKSRETITLRLSKDLSYTARKPPKLWKMINTWYTCKKTFKCSAHTYMELQEKSNEYCAKRSK